MGAYVSYDEQNCTQPAQSDEQLAWQLHRELLLERRPRRATARFSRQTVHDLARPESDSSDEYALESGPESDRGNVQGTAPVQAPLVLAALKASSERTIQVSTEPVIVRIPALDGSHSATLVATVVPCLGAQAS